jgi:hypothetical protein
VLQVFRYNAVRIGKRRLGKLERNAVLQMVLTIFPLIPFEASARHDNTADAKDTYKNMGCKVRRFIQPSLVMCIGWTVRFLHTVNFLILRPGSFFTGELTREKRDSKWHE